MADRVVVMYLGQVMESGTTEEVFSAPWHPYTEALLSAIPLSDAAARLSRIVLQGESCETQKPVEQRLAQGSHRIVCGIVRTNSRGCFHHRNYFEKLEEAIDEALMIELVDGPACWVNLTLSK
jgi:ABC-type dipeptide/oligopeptide/nickel transport system ATPase component